MYASSSNPAVRDQAPRRGSGWKWLFLFGGIGILGLFLLCGVGGVVGLVILGANSYGTRIALKNGNELYYTPAVTEAEARKVADYLDTKFPDNKGKVATYQLNKAGGKYEFRAVVQEGKENDNLAVVAFQAMGVLLSLEVLDGAPVDVHLCDRNLKTVRVLDHLPKKA
jgi:hypothetical protein